MAYPLAIALTCMLLVTGCGGDDGPARVGPTVPSPTEPGEDGVTRMAVTFLTSDNKHLTGYLSTSDESPPGSPGVVLVHEHKSNADQWGTLPGELAKAGYRTLAFNLRGHKDSEDYDGDIDNILIDPNGAPLDVFAAILYLLGIGAADDTRIAVVGTSFGGNLAVAASLRDWATTYVAISPTVDASLTLSTVPALNGLQSVFYISTEDDSGGEAADCQTMFDATSDPREIHTYPGSGHGAAIAAEDDAHARVIDWLDSQLR